jgi:hypothetical protein
MPFSSAGLGVIHMERKPSRVDSFREREQNLDCAGELIRLARGERTGDSPPDASADKVVYADTQRLAEELSAEYAAVCDTIESLRR